MKFRLLLPFALLVLLGLSRADEELCKTMPTVAEVLYYNPRYNLTAKWSNNTGSNVLLSVPTINITVFVAADDAAAAGLKEWDGRDVSYNDVGTGPRGALGGYGVIVGNYSVDDFLQVPSINSVQGQTLRSDYALRMFKNEKGDTLIEGSLAGKYAKLVNTIPACNGVVYEWDRFLLPSEDPLAFYAAYAKLASESLADIQDTSSDFVGNGSRCSIDLPASISTEQEADAWLQLWDDIDITPAMTDQLLSATVLVPLDSNLVGPSREGYKNPATVLYNMVRGAYCPDELAAAAGTDGVTLNSMLGDVTNEEYPLRFSNENGTLYVSSLTGSARVLKSMIACQSVVLFTDTALKPPAAAVSEVSTSPSALPTFPVRHETCVVPPTRSKDYKPFPIPEDRIMKNFDVSDYSDPGSDGDSDSGSDNALAIGLGVGLGCAALIAVGAGAFVYRRKRISASRSSSDNKSPLDSDESKDEAGSGDIEFIAPRDDLDWGSAPAAALYGSLVSFNVDGSMVHYTARVNEEASQTDGTFSTVTAQTADDPTSLGTTTAPRSGSTTFSAGISRLASTNSSLDMWEIAPEDVQISITKNGQPVELGRGSFGAVYRGYLRGVQPTAIKVLNASVGAEAESAFQREAAILKHVSRDRNIVQLYGTAKMPDGKLLLLTELMEGGDLRQALDNPAIAPHLRWHKKGKQVALDIARGLTALHSNNVIHRDLKSKNVLLTSTLNAKVGDVGIAAVHSKGYLTVSAGVMIGTLAWSAPEVLLNKRCSEKIDIFSFGVVLLEIATGKVPQRGFMDLPPPCDQCPAELAALIKDCIRENPKRRPSAKEVYERILKIPPIVSV